MRINNGGICRVQCIVRNVNEIWDKIQGRNRGFAPDGKIWGRFSGKITSAFSMAIAFSE